MTNLVVVVPLVVFDAWIWAHVVVSLFLILTH